MRLIQAILALLLLSAPAAASDPAALSTRWAADWSAKRLDAVMALYAPQPLFLPTIGPRWEGAAAIRSNCTGLLATYDPHIALRSLKSATSGDLAYDSGVYDETLRPVKGGKAIAAKGAYLFLFQRQGGGAWKILEQTFTSFAPINL
ncbi:MAG TPA: DUF4440 domain-containing protein [Rhizomicrobium sp.]|jgi:ketosteroid isomerase-like protein|nr:DUF4440 domain-containing protein [Rhizomicrobium sp.]